MKKFDKWPQAGFLFLITIVYTSISLFINHSLFRQTGYAHYNYLVNAFLHGRLNVISPHSYDLSFYHGNFFLYWGPAPTLFILPFYVLSRLNTSDVFYTLVAGIINVFLFYFIIGEAVTFFKLKLSNNAKMFMVGCFAFASPNYYLSLGGKIWHTNQIIAVFFLLIFLLFYFKFLTRSRTLFFALALLFFNLAWLSRESLLYYAPLFLYPVILKWKAHSREAKKLFFLTIIITTTFFVFFAFYNYARFESPLETGMSHQLANERYQKLIHENKILSLEYLPHNIQYEILNPFSFSLTPPFMKWDSEGNGIFFVYPLLFTLVYFAKVKIKERYTRIFLYISLLVVTMSITTLLMYMGTGWYQFGSRYYFDNIPLLFLITIFIVKKVPVPLRYLIFFYGAIINTIGVITFPWFL